MTQDEHDEWYGTVGFYESMGEEIGFREESLTGLIIAIWKLVNNLSITTSRGLNRKKSSSIDKFTIFRQGPMINSEYWAHCVNAASNYVRHADDWNKKFSPLLKKGSGDWKADLPESNSKRNLEILVNIGLDAERLISSNDLSYQVAEKLGIITKSQFSSTFKEWSEAVLEFTRNEL